MDRRTFFISSSAIVAGGLGALWLRNPILGTVDAKGAEDKIVTVVQFSDDGKKLGTASIQKVRKTEAEWKQQLTPQEFDITREAGTERAFTGQYAESHDKGLYRCICCGNALFSSDTKFDSGTGWPSFWEPIAEKNVRTRVDLTLAHRAKKFYAWNATPISATSSTTAHRPHICATV